jgi:ABC-type bacteriocin/lantibiotic exporter with double-glycine peptidase domain
MQALFRIEELADGNIIVDGIDIGQVDIVTARRAFTIIPQDPFIFAGMIVLFFLFLSICLVFILFVRLFVCFLPFRYPALQH